MDGLYSYEYNEEYPWYATASGVTPNPPDCLFVPFYTRYNEVKPDGKALVEVTSDATALTGGGSKEVEATTPSSAAAALTSVKSVEESLKDDSLVKAEAQELQKRVDLANQAVINKKVLRVETLKAEPRLETVKAEPKKKGKRVAAKASEVEGFGKRKKLKHCFKFV